MGLFKALIPGKTPVFNSGFDIEKPFVVTNEAVSKVLDKFYGLPGLRPNISKSLLENQAVYAVTNQEAMLCKIVVENAGENLTRFSGTFYDSNKRADDVFESFKKKVLAALEEK